MLVPAMTFTVTPASSNTFKTPMWASARAAAQRQADLPVPGRAGRLGGGQSPRQERAEREQQAAPSHDRSLKRMVSYPRERRGCHRRKALAFAEPRAKLDAGQRKRNR